MADPTPMQAVPDVHETPDNEPYTDWMLQALPSHDSTKAEGPPKPNTDPIAMQAEAVLHEIEVMERIEAPVGFGVGWINQLVPFQTSARVMAPVPLSCVPTASHAVREVHDTASSEAFAKPEGFTVDILDQADPFHLSPKVAPLPASLMKLPTAMQPVLEGHETPLSRPWGAVW